MTLSQAQSRQVGYLTAGAVALFVAFRLLPTGTDLNHMDFRVTGGNVIEFCDPSNPQFLPVVSVRSPVALGVRAESPAVAGQPVQLRLTLATTGGKPIGPAELVVAHTRRLHLMIVDESLGDYQHVHPEAAAKPGEWTVGFTPRHGGLYRVFADFTPAATNRGLYASADLRVEHGSGPAAAAAEAPAGSAGSAWVERNGTRFRLVPAQPVRAGAVADLNFELQRVDGGALQMEPIMGALAHLVAFDSARTGFAHLHPAADDPARTDPAAPANQKLSFKITIPKAGRYVIWSQVKLAAVEMFVPFRLDVLDQ